MTEDTGDYVRVRYEACRGDCTVDCGHCKGDGPPDPCPECGYDQRFHGGWGGPGRCTLTDNGVAQRLHKARRTAAVYGSYQQPQGDQP